MLARNNAADGNTLSPVIVFFHSPQLGPIKGKKWMYESLGRNFAKMGYTVVIPDLTFYPEGKAKQMVQDVRRVLNWTMINIRWPRCSSWASDGADWMFLQEIRRRSVANPCHGA